MSYIAKNGRLYTSGASEALTLLDDKFSVNKSYSKGDSCIYNDYLWKFTSDKPAGEWDSSVVEQCRIMDFVDSVTNKHKVTQFTVDTSSWTSDTTSQSGTTLYKKSIALNHVYVESPSVDIGSTGVLPTTAQQDAYNLLQYVTVDSAVPCLYLYSSDIPTDSFYINVEGVD